MRIQYLPYIRDDLRIVHHAFSVAFRGIWNWVARQYQIYLGIAERKYIGRNQNYAKSQSIHNPAPINGSFGDPRVSKNLAEMT